MSKKRDVCECLKQSAKAKKPRYVTLAGKIKQTPAAKFTYFLCAWRANLSQPQDQRLKYINHVARKQITVYYTHGLENKNYRSSFLTWGRERKWEKGIKYLKIAELLFLLLWRKKGPVTSFHLTLPILPSTQYSETQEVLSTISSRIKYINCWVKFWNISETFLWNYVEFESTLLLEQPSRSHCIRGTKQQLFMAALVCNALKAA